MLSILKPKFRGKRLADITMREVETVARSLKNERGITGARVNRYLMCLSGLFNQAAKWGEYNAPNPVKNATKYPESPPRTKYLGQEELARLLNAANPDLWDVIVVAVSTGMRQGELFSLRCGDIDFENELIRIPNSKNGERRDVPMSAEVKKILERRRQPLKERLVFCKPDGTKFSNCMRTAWYNALKEAGLEDFRFHDLRHTFASQLMMSGEVGQFDLQELLGHKSLSMTRRYTHLQIASKRKAVSVMDKMLDFHSKEQVADSDGHKLDTSSNQVETKNA